MAALCAAAGVLAVALALVGGEDERGFRDGPLETFDSNGYVSPVVVGRPAFYGVPIVFNRGEQPITLRAASFADATPGLEVFDVMVAGSKRGYASVGSDPRYPRGSTGLSDLHPIEGFQVEPMSTPAGERGIELVFFLRADRKGSYRSRGVEVEYEVDGENYREVFPNSYLACVGDPPYEKIPDCGNAKPGIERP